MSNDDASVETQAERKAEIIRVYFDPDTKDVVGMYDKWDLEYEQDMGELGYVGPKTMAAKIRYYFPHNKDARILDIGCGTGWVAKELAVLGYTNIDGVDPSQSLLAQATDRNLYRATVNAYVGSEPLPLPDESYDAVVGCAVFGGLSTDAILDLYRLIKPGGVMMMLSNRAWWYNIATNAASMQAQLDQLQADCKWKRLELSIIDDYMNLDDNSPGHFFVYRKLAPKTMDTRL